jgi:hypothetical protein
VFRGSCGEVMGSNWNMEGNGQPRNDSLIWGRANIEIWKETDNREMTRWYEGGPLAPSQILLRGPSDQTLPPHISYRPFYYIPPSPLSSTWLLLSSPLRAIQIYVGLRKYMNMTRGSCCITFFYGSSIKINKHLFGVVFYQRKMRDKTYLVIALKL